MKKLLVMVIALAVVFGMSAGVMAELDSDSIEVNVTNEPYAEIILDETSATLNFTEPGVKAEDSVDFTLKTNTDNTFIKLNENISRRLADIIFEENDHILNLSQAKQYIWAFNDDLGEFNDHLLSPSANIHYHSGNWGQWTQGIEYTSNAFTRGITNSSIEIGSEYRDDTGYDWTDLPSDLDFKGDLPTVEITVFVD